MDALEARLQARLPLWGKWQIAERIYRSSSCSVYALSGERLGQPLSSVVKVITLLGQGDELEEKLQLALEEIRSMECLRGCRNIVTLYDDCLFPLECGGELAGYDILIRMERLTCLTDLLREGTILEGRRSLPSGPGPLYGAGSRPSGGHHPPGYQAGQHLPHSRRCLSAGRFQRCPAGTVVHAGNHDRDCRLHGAGNRPGQCV